MTRTSRSLSVSSSAPGPPMLVPTTRLPSTSGPVRRADADRYRHTNATLGLHDLNPDLSSGLMAAAGLRGDRVLGLDLVPGYDSGPAARPGGGRVARGRARRIAPIAKISAALWPHAACQSSVPSPDPASAPGRSDSRKSHLNCPAQP